MKNFNLKDQKQKIPEIVFALNGINISPEIMHDVATRF